MSFWLLGIGGLLLALRAEVFWFPPARPPLRGAGERGFCWDFADKTQIN